MKKKGQFQGRIQYEDSTVLDFRGVSFDEMSKRLALLQKKFK